MRASTSRTSRPSLEHIRDWRQTIREAARILRPEGVLYLSTNNRLWPIQAEIRYLHGFGYLPASLQRRIYAWVMEHRPDMVGYTHLPGVPLADVLAGGEGA
jgi:SAM-dependent methyltransferase